MIALARNAAEPAAAPEIRVVVADERRLLAEALAALLGTMAGFVVAGVVTHERDLGSIGPGPPDVLLVAVDTASNTGFGLVRAIRARMPDVETVIVADALVPELVRFVLEQRLGGLLLSDMSAPGVATCLDEIVHGRAVMPVGWQGMLAADRDCPLEALSGRQLEVLKLLADGCSYEEIGTRLFITLNTVKFHVRSIFVRLGVGNRMAAARIFAQHSRPAPIHSQAAT